MDEKSLETTLPVLEPSAFSPSSMRTVTVQRHGSTTHLSQDWLAEEVPVALVYNGIAHAVMMASPQQLSLFAFGFSLSEGIIASPADIYDVEEHPVSNGIELHVTLSTRAFEQLKLRRRSMVGRTGCGLCGTEQLGEVCQRIPALPHTQFFSLKHLDRCLRQIESQQTLGQSTGCTHAAAWLSPDGQVMATCEDVGRHIALDKLLGLRAQRGWRDGAALVTSRASYEMVQKAARCGVEILFAVSAATSLAVDTAQRCGLSLVGFSRPGRAVLYTGSERLPADAQLRQ